MFKTKYFLTLIVIQLFWTITLCNPNLIIYDLIKLREILDDGEIVTTDSLFKNDTMYDSTDSSKHPHVMYTSLKCMYADTVVDLLQTFFEIFLYGINSHVKINIFDITKNWMISAVHHFNNIQTPIAKMIDSLFSYSNEYKKLRTSDQSLLKSLLSINLFLYYSVNENPIIVYNKNESIDILNDIDFDKTMINVRSLNTSIIQMIGLIERFRSKRCVVRDPFEYNYAVNGKMNDNLIYDVRNIQSLLQPTLQRINVLINEGSDNYDDFNRNMFDPEYLLFENLLTYNNSFLGNIQVDLNGNESDLTSIYHDMKNTYSIDHVLEFQHILIKVIADVFYIRIHRLSNNSLDDMTITELTRLQANFSKYIDNMLPSNCSLKVCNKILKAGAYFEKILKNFDSNILTKLGNQFEPENNIEIINQKFQNDFLEDPSLFSLTDMIWEDTQLTSFRRVIKLLSYESYTNNDFVIGKISDHMKITNSRSYNKKFVKSMIDMQYVLLAFWSLLKMKENYQIPKHIIQYSTVDLSDITTIGFTAPENYTDKSRNELSELKCDTTEEYGQIILDLIRAVVRFYKNSKNKPAVQNILLPILIHFKDTDECACQTSTYDLSVTLQITFLTITLIENYLIRNYSFALYTIFLYSTFFMNTINGPDTSQLRHDLQTFAESSKINFDDMLKLLVPIYNASSFDSFSPEDDRKIVFVWNGSKQFGSDVYQNVKKGVTDFNDLIRLQWFSVKWFVSKILLNIRNVLKLFSECEYGFEEAFYVLKYNLLELVEIEFPKSIKIFLDDIFNASLILLNIDLTDFNVHIFGKMETLILFGVKMLDAHPTSNEPICAETVNIINSIIYSDIEKLKRLSKENVFGTQNMLNSTDLSLSPVKNTIYIYNKIVKISID